MAQIVSVTDNPRGYEVQGKVFLDKNQNGVWDSGEKLLQGIQISNGSDLVLTDRHGAFSIRLHLGQSVFPILKGDLRLTNSDGRLLNSNFFYADPDSLHLLSRSCDFPVQKSKLLNRFTFGAIGDIQVGDSIELNYAAKSIFSELTQQDHFQFNMILGDLINDDVNLFSPMKTMIKNLPTPSWTLPGNHDRNVKDLNRLEDDFLRNFGASTYAFYAGKAFFMVFNNVQSTQKFGYEGRYLDSQLQFMKKALSHVSKNQLIVVNQHMPMGLTKNREAVFELLKGYQNVLILSGHTHQVSRHFYENGTFFIHELVVGAPAGSWWTGEKSIDGVPLALMQCGSPRNYFTIDVRENTYKINFKGIGLDPSQQMYIEIDSNQLVANVFAGSQQQTRVYTQINDGEWLAMKSDRISSPNVRTLIEKYKAKIYPTLGNRNLPLRDQRSPHVWSLTSHNLLKKGLVKIKIKAEDDFGLSVEQEQWFFNH